MGRGKQTADRAVALSYGCIEGSRWHITSPARWFAIACATLNSPSRLHGQI